MSTLATRARSVSSALELGRRRCASACARWLGQIDWIMEPLLAFGLSRLLIFAVAIVGALYFPMAEGHWIADPENPFLSMWAKWDSQWYIQIAEQGYIYQPLRQSNVAFFPIYPLSIRLVTPFLRNNSVLAGVVLSNLAFLVALIFLYRLTVLELVGSGSTTQDEGRAAARRTVYYLAFFPTAFFFSAVYTESFFFLFSVATVYFSRRQQWVLAAAAGMLAAATRNIGVFLWLLVMWQWLRFQGWRVTRMYRLATWRNLWSGIKNNWTDVIFIAAIPLGILLYIWFLQVNFARPFAFVEVQAAWGRQNIGPIAVVTRELRALLDLEANQSTFSRILNLSAFLAVLAMVPAIWRRLGEGYAFYVLLLMLMPAASALQSMIRYVLPLFPVFMLLGWWGRHAFVDRAVLVTFSILLGLLTTIWVSWIFVA